MFPSPTLPRQALPGPALHPERPTQGPAADPAPTALPQRQAARRDGPPAGRPRQALAILQPQVAAEKAAWRDRPLHGDSATGDSAWWAAMASQLRAQEQAGPRPASAMPATRPMPESDDESEDGDFPMVLCGTSPRTPQSLSDLSPIRAEALARHAGEIAAIEDFSQVLRLPENNYEALARSVWDLHDAALHCRAEWQAGGEAESLARAQSLAIKHKILDGLCTLKQQQPEWDRHNPQIHERVIRSLREGLVQCRQAGAAAFPIRGFDAPLQELEHRMQALQGRLERGERVPLPGDPDAAQVRARAWRNLGRAMEDCHGPQDWEAMDAVMAEGRLEAYTYAQAQRVSGELLAAMRSPLPMHRLQATTAALLPLMEPMAWALARQVHSEISRTGHPLLDGRARHAAELQHRMEAFAAALAGPLQRRLATVPATTPDGAAAADALLLHEMGGFARRLAWCAHHDLVMAQHNHAGHTAAQEAMLQVALRPPMDPPARAAERAALGQRLMRTCRALGQLAAELQAVLRGPPASSAAGAVDPQPGALAQALQALQLADIPACDAAPSSPRAPQTAVPQPAAGRAHRAHSPARAETAIAPSPRARPGPHPGLQPASEPAGPDHSRGGPAHGGSPDPEDGVASPGLSPGGSPPEPAIDTAAQGQQEQAAAFQEALAPFLAEAQRCVADAQARQDAGPAAGPAWMRHSLEFTAWQKAVLTHDACSEQITAQANALFGPAGPEPASVQSLREAAAQASRDALARAAEAALQTWESFSQTCDAALVQSGKGEQVRAADCQRLHAQWLGSPLRERLPALVARMTQYSAFEIACNALADGADMVPAAAVDAVSEALQLRAAIDISQRASRGLKGAQAERLKAFREVCAKRRDRLLNHAVGAETRSLASLQDAVDLRLAPALSRCGEVSIAYDTLLAGHPLPEKEAPAQEVHTGPPAAPAADQRLIESTRAILLVARHQCESTLELPPETPGPALLAYQTIQAIVRRGELRVRMVDVMLSGFHALAGQLEAAAPTQRAQLAKDQREALMQVNHCMEETLQDLCKALKKPLSQTLLERGAQGAALLRADLRLIQRTSATLQILEHLLSLRVAANRTLRGVRRGQFDPIEDPALRSDTHQETVREIERAKLMMLKDVDDEAKLLGEHPDMETERTHIRDGQRRLKCQAEFEEAAIRAQLLLARAERARSNPAALAAGHPFSITDLQQSITTHTKDLLRVNREIKEIRTSSDQSRACEARLKINAGLQRRLLELQLVLRNDLEQAPEPPSTALEPAPAAPTAAAGGSRQGRRTAQARARR